MYSTKQLRRLTARNAATPSRGSPGTAPPRRGNASLRAAEEDGERAEDRGDEQRQRKRRMLVFSFADCGVVLAMKKIQRAEPAAG
jgi:hypothetical protein